MALLPRGPVARLGLGLAGLLLAPCVLAGCTSSGGHPPAPTSPSVSVPSSAAGTSLPGTPTAPPTAPSTAAPTAPTSAPSTSGPTTTSPSPAARTVAVQITFSGWDGASHSAQVNALVPSVVARDGRCTLTLSSGSTQRTTTVAAHSTPQATNCGLMSIPGAQLAAGAWQAVVTFRSGEAVGASKPVSIQVPA